MQPGESVSGSLILSHEQHCFKEQFGGVVFKFISKLQSAIHRKVTQVKLGLNGGKHPPLSAQSQET